MREAALRNQSQKIDDFDINRGVSQNLEKFFKVFIAFSDTQESKAYPGIGLENTLNIEADFSFWAHPRHR